MILCSKARHDAGSLPPLLHGQDTVEHDEFPGVHFLKLATIAEAVELLLRNDQVIKQFDVQEVAGIDEFFSGGDIGPGRL